MSSSPDRRAACRRHSATQGNAVGAPRADLSAIDSQARPRSGRARRERGGVNRWPGRPRRSAGLDLRPDRLDPGQHLLPQVGGDLLVAAVPVDQLADHLLEPVLAQARPALLEVDLDLGVALLVQLPVQVAVDPVEDLATRDLVGSAAAHLAYPRGAWACGDESVPAAAMPSSAA